jgi:cell division protein ZipA
MMESTIRYILLFIGTIIILWILRDGLRRKKQREGGAVKQSKKKQDPANILFDEVFSREAKKNKNKSEQPTEKAQVEIKEPVVEDIIDPVIKDESSEPAVVEDGLSQNKIISILVMASNGNSFGGYDLLQTLLASNLHYGEMQIFHSYSKDSNLQNKKLFSLASVSEPGDFDLSKIGGYTCKGLVLFMDVAEQTKPVETFNSMLETAGQLVSELGGELRSGKNQPWSDGDAEKIRGELF